jgi:hypothetical protein
MLEYIKLRSRKDRDVRVTEEERKVFETLKIVLDGNWIIRNEIEYLNILKEIDIVNNIND